MKKSAILKLFSLVTFAAAGAFAIANVKSSKKAESVSADAPATRTVYLNAASGWTTANAWFAVYQYEYETVNTEGTNYYYFVNNKGWSTVKAHMWGGPGTATGWPGIDTEKVGLYVDSTGYHDVYRVEIRGINLIFNDGNGSQTSDLTNKSAGYVYYEGSSDTAITYYHPTGTSSWVKMTKVSYAAKDIYQASVQRNNYAYIFTRMDPAKDTLEWDSKWNQSYDLFGVPEGKNCYEITSMSGDKHPGDWHHFNANNDDVEYAVGTFSRDPWHVDTGIKLVASETPDELKVTLPLKANDEFRFYVNRSYDPGYETSEKFVMKTGEGGSPIAATIVENNVVMPSNIEEGAYTIYWSYASENWGLYICVATEDTADSLATYIMQSDTSGQCATKFAKAKTRFLAMTDATEIAAFKASAAATRYEAWAANQRQKPYEEGAVAASPYVVGGTESNNLIVIVSIVSLISASTLVGLIVIKRRRGIAK